MIEIFTPIKPSACKGQPISDCPVFRWSAEPFIGHPQTLDYTMQVK